MKPGKSLPASVDFHRLKYMEKVLFEDSENTSGPWTWLSGTLPLVVILLEVTGRKSTAT